MRAEEDLRGNLTKLHTTPMGAERVRKNLALGEVNVAAWCRERIALPGCKISRQGKNWYAETEGCVITVNAHSWTIITAHKRKGPEAKRDEDTGDRI